MFVFHFLSIRAFLVEIEEITYLTFKIKSQGHNKNRQQSNQVIYGSGYYTKNDRNLKSHSDVIA